MRLIALLFVPVLVVSDPAQATDYKEIVLAPGYEHDRFDTRPRDLMKEFRAFVTCFDSPDDDNGDGTPDTLGVPHWVAYELRAYTQKLPRRNRPSPWMTERKWYRRRLAPGDDSYRGSGYSRGHLCMKSHASRLGAYADWNTHTTVNAVPQLQSHNVGPWLRLENMTADWADVYGAVWIVAGPVFADRTPSRWIGDGEEIRVAVPDALYKIVIKASDDPYRPDVLAFMFPHEKKPAVGWPELTSYVVSVDRIEVQTGLDFLTVLPDEAEADVESTAGTVLWGSGE